MVSQNILETSRAYWELQPSFYHNRNKSQNLLRACIPRSARCRRNGVDWSCFTNDVESKLTNRPHKPNLSLRVSYFNEILLSAATTHAEKSKPSKRSNRWMTPHVRAEIRTQNRLHQTIHQNCQEWIDACREATEAINVAKSESWKNLLQNAMSNSNGPNM